MFKEFWSLSKHKRQKQKGEINIVFLVLIAIAIILCTQFYGAIQGAINGNGGTLTIPNAVSLLLGNGYAVSAQGGTFNGNVNATTITATTLNAPTGRTASYVIAGNGVSGTQADATLSGTSMQIAINAELVVLNALGTHQTLALVGTFECDGQINAVSNVDVIGTNSTINVTSATGCVAVYWNNITNSVWKDLNIYRKGNVGNLSLQCVKIEGNSTDSTCQITRCKFINQVTSTYTGEGKLNGVFVGQYCTPSPIFTDCEAWASTNDPNAYLNDGWDIHVVNDQVNNVLGTPKFYNCIGHAGSGALSSGWAVTEANAAEFYNCFGYGETGNCGWAINDCSPKLYGCKGYAGANSTSVAASGFWCWAGGSPYLSDCEGISSTTNASYSLNINYTSSPLIEGFYGHPPINTYQWYYAVANNGRWRPFATPAYGITAASVWVTTASAGITIDIGTTVGGHEIAQSIDISTQGSKTFTFTAQQIAAGGYIYVTPSAPIAEQAVFMYYTVVNSVATARNAQIDTTGFAVIKDSHFSGSSPDGYCIPMTIGTNAVSAKNWKIYNTLFESLATATGRCLYSDATLVNTPIYDSQFIGRFYVGVTSFADNSNVANGFINSGQTKTASGSLTAGNANAFAFTWNNPESQAIIIKSVTIEVVTGGSALSVIDVGTAINATTHSSNLIAGGDLATAGFLVSSNLQVLDASGGTTTYITGQILTANAAAPFVAKYYIIYCGR